MSDKMSQDTERRDYGTCIGYKRSQFVFPRQFPAESGKELSFVQRVFIILSDFRRISLFISQVS
jgi:hypothetical protein